MSAGRDHVDDREGGDLRWVVAPDSGPLRSIMLEEPGGASRQSVLADGDVLLFLGGRLRRFTDISGGIRWEVECQRLSDSSTEVTYHCQVGAEETRLVVRWQIDGALCRGEMRSESLAGVRLPERVALARSVRMPFLNWGASDDPMRIFQFEKGTRWQGGILGISVPMGYEGGYSIKANTVWGGVRPGGTVALDLVVSGTLSDVLPSRPLRRSPRYDTLSQYVVLDSCRDVPFEDEELRWRELSEFGLERVVAIRHAWQRLGYDRGYPEVMPANSEMGGDRGLISLARAAKESGWLFAVHEMFAAGDASEPANLARTMNGNLVPFMLDPSTDEQMYEIALERSVELARNWSPRIHDRYSTTASFLDVHTAVGPWRFAHGRLDASGSFGSAAACVKRLVDAVRSSHGGPLLGEGGMHYLHAGHVDGFEAEVAEGADSPVVVDFALRNIAPYSVCHGMGYFQRWASVPVNSPLPTRLIDAYRAREIAFGHAGYIASEYLCHHPREAIKEYHMVGGLQRYYIGIPFKDIAYEIAGDYVSAERALQETNYPPRVRVVYSNGLAIFVNTGEEEWCPDGNWKIPTDGWMATVDGRLLGGSVLFGGIRCDVFLESDSAIVDARSDYRQQGVPTVVRFGVLETNACVRLFKSGRESVDIQLVYPGGGESMAHLAVGDVDVWLDSAGKRSRTVKLEGAGARFNDVGELLR